MIKRCECTLSVSGHQCLWVAGHLGKHKFDTLAMPEQPAEACLGIPSCVVVAGEEKKNWRGSEKPATADALWNVQTNGKIMSKAAAFRSALREFLPSTEIWLTPVELDGDFWVPDGPSERVELELKVVERCTPPAAPIKPHRWGWGAESDDWVKNRHWATREGALSCAQNALSPLQPLWLVPLKLDSDGNLESIEGGFELFRKAGGPRGWVGPPPGEAPNDGS